MPRQGCPWSYFSQVLVGATLGRKSLCGHSQDILINRQTCQVLHLRHITRMFVFCRQWTSQHLERLVKYGIEHFTELLLYSLSSYASLFSVP